MALKIWKDGTMTSINTGLHKPVTFINGTKYKLDKAYTFVNGVKQEIWGEGGVQVDYISSTGVLSCGNIFSIGDNWANGSYNNSVSRLDINNLSNPSLIQQVAWGNVLRANCYQMSQQSGVFESWNKNNRTGYKLLESAQTGEITVDFSSQLTATSSATNFSGFVGITNSSIITVFSVYAGSAGTGHTPVYNKTFYWNNVAKYFSEYDNLGYAGVMQTENESYLVNTSTSRISNIRKLTVSGVSGVLSQLSFSGFYDNGNIFVSCILNKIAKRAANDVGTDLYTYVSESGRYCKLLGKIGSYIYVLDYPSTMLTTSEVKLVLLDETDLSVVYEKTLPVSPFNEDLNFWTSCVCYPQNTNTGFLAVSTYNTSTLGLRVARFSALI